MKNFIAKGITLNILVPAGGLLSGAPHVVGLKVVVCTTNGAEGETIAANATGVFELPKEAGVVVAQGVALYLDAATGEINTTNTDVFAGYAYEAEVAGAATVKVVLGGVAN